MGILLPNENAILLPPCYRQGTITNIIKAENVWCKFPCPSPKTFSAIQSNLDFNGGERAPGDLRQGQDEEMVKKHKIPREENCPCAHHGLPSPKPSFSCQRSSQSYNVVAVSIYVNPSQFSPNEYLST
ncbi:hypothetical protein L6164_003278 [Bauhinia variegata]|uniref:Uncharacterized protein n=1 Tax=Bauhinia variegata TaxID=167791 RepID=A0ACB9Q0V3_BAUVA|nr:hypothetical protein L6164_003278 [Bauhinia variegata]